MTHDYGALLAAIRWDKLDPLDAQAIYTLTVTACRATRGGCFCGCHVTPLDETRPAPELPRKVKAGTTLTVGARYRITEIASWNVSPANKPGDEANCSRLGRCGTLKPNWREHTLSWYCRALHDGEDGTYVTGLELVAEAPAKDEL